MNYGIFEMVLIKKETIILLMSEEQAQWYFELTFSRFCSPFPSGKERTLHVKSLLKFYL